MKNNLLMKRNKLFVINKNFNCYLFKEVETEKMHNNVNTDYF